MFQTVIFLVRRSKSLRSFGEETLERSGMGMENRVWNGELARASARASN